MSVVSPTVALTFEESLKVLEKGKNAIIAVLVKAGKLPVMLIVSVYMSL